MNEGNNLIKVEYRPSKCKDIPIGKCILFPGMVTHGHACQPLTKGVKYSFTIWSNRYPGDGM